VASEQILRMAVTQQIEELSLRDLIVRIDDSQMLRFFCRFYDDALPAHNTYATLVNLLRPETWEKINEVVVRYARKRKKCAGKKLRVDTTAVETDVHYPTDSSLLYDSVRVLTRTLGYMRKVSPAVVGPHRGRVKDTKRLVYRLVRGGAKLHEGTRKKLYRKLIAGTERVMAWAAEVRARVAAGVPAEMGLLAQLELKSWAADLEKYLPLAAKCVKQARERVLEGKPVPNEKKIFSIFEPHTELLIRGKKGKAVEFGHMVELRQVDGGLITHYRVHERRPAEAPLLVPAVEAHQELFGRVPEVCAADRGFYAKEELQKVEVLGVKEVCVPKKGKRTAAEEEREHSRWFKRGQAFRAGIEGMISVLKRGYGWRRCLREGFARFESWVGGGVLARNLVWLAGG
jgi:IS5 family transposase